METCIYGLICAIVETEKSHNIPSTCWTPQGSYRRNSSPETRWGKLMIQTSTWKPSNRNAQCWGQCPVPTVSQGQVVPLSVRVLKRFTDVRPYWRGSMYFTEVTDSKAILPRSTLTDTLEKRLNWTLVATKLVHDNCHSKKPHSSCVFSQGGNSYHEIKVTCGRDFHMLTF